MVLRYKLAIQTLLLRSLKFRLFQISVVEIWQQVVKAFPLVPAFHQALFQHPSIHRVILNLGGIANVSMLPANNPDGVFGFDTGPANILMDAWCHRHTGHPYDENGDWAAYGHPIRSLLDRLYAHEYFSKEPPKSTGREDFNIDWLDDQLIDWRNDLTYDELEDTPENIQATLLKLTVRAIQKRSIVLIWKQVKFMYVVVELIILIC